MPTNPIPRGTKNLSVNVPDALHAELKRLAAASDMKLSHYVRHILTLAIQQELQVRTSYIAQEKEPLKVAEEEEQT